MMNNLKCALMVAVTLAATVAGQEEFVGSKAREERVGLPLSTARMMTDHLRAMGIAWDRPWATTKDMERIDRLAPLTLDEWKMLADEASTLHAGVTDERLQMFAASREVNLGSVDGVAATANVDKSAVLDAVRMQVAILERAEKWGSETITVEDAEIDAYIEDVLREVEIATAVLKSEDFLHKVEAPADEALAAFFASQQGDSCDSSRYVIPHRVRFEYIELKRASIKAMINPDETALQDYFAQYRAERWDGESFEDVRADVAETYKTALAGGIAKQVMEGLKADLNAPWKSAKVGDDGFPVAPVAVAATDYLQRVAADTARRLNVPLAVVDSGLVTAEELATLEGISASRWYPEDGLPVKFQFLPMAVQGIKKKPRPGSRDWAFAMYEPTDVLMAKTPGEGSSAWYIGRVVEVAEPKPAPDLYWDFERVRSDWQRAEAARIAESHAKQLLNDAASVGLLTAWEGWVEKDDLSASILITPEPFSKRTETGGEFAVTHIATRVAKVRGVEDRSFVPQCFTLADDVISAAKTSGQVPSVLAGAMPLANDAGWAVVEFLKFYEPPEVPTDQRARVAHRLRIEKFYRKILQWFDPAAIRMRAAKRG